MKKYRIEVVKKYHPLGDKTPLANSLFYTFPSLAKCRDGSFLLAALEGKEKTSPDGKIKLFRSEDHFQSWIPLTSPSLYDEQHNSSYGYLMCHLTEISDKCLLAVYLRANRFNPDEPLFNPETSGIQHCVIRVSKSFDNGQSWAEPKTPEYKIPDILIPHGCIVDSELNLGILCEVWFEWDKGFQGRPFAPFIISEDNGETWQKAAIMAQDPQEKCIYGDARLAVCKDGKYKVLLWKHDFTANKDLPIHMVESLDKGQTWSMPASTGILGQIANPIELLFGDLFVTVYQKRHGAGAGLRAILSYDGGKSWDSESDILLWKGGRTDNPNPFEGYSDYSFGYSSVTKINENKFLVTFWADNGKTTNITIIEVDAYLQ